MEQVTSNLYNFSISWIKVIYKVLASAAFLGTVKFFPYMVILENSKDSAEHPNTDGVSQ